MGSKGLTHEESCYMCIKYRYDVSHGIIYDDLI